MIDIIWFYLGLYYAFNLGVTVMLYIDADFREMTKQSRIAAVVLSLLMALPIMIWAIFCTNNEVKRRLDEMDK